MQRVHEHDTTPHLFRLSTYHTLRLVTRKETTELAAEYSTLHTTLETAITAWEKAKLNRTLQSGVLQGTDAEFDLAVSRLNNHLLARVDKNRDSALYRTFFPTGKITDTLRAPYLHSVMVAHQIREAATTYPDAAPEQAVQAVISAAEEMATLLDSLEKKSAVVARHENAMEIARIPLIKAYNENFHRLKLIFPDRPGLVESFFLKSRRDNKDDRDESATMTHP